MRISFALNRRKNVRLLISGTLFVLLFFGICITSYSQDILKLKSGTELKVTIIEETAELVKYREYENQSGPVYSISRDKVESVRYRKGSRQVNETGIQAAVGEEKKIRDENTGPAGEKGELVYRGRQIFLDGVRQGPREIITLMEDTPEALRHFEKGRKMLSASSTGAVAVIVTSFVSSQIANNKNDQQEKQAILIAGLAVDGAIIVTSVVLAAAGKSNLKKSVEIYNSSLKNSRTYSFNIGLTDNGLGLGIRF